MKRYGKLSGLILLVCMLWGAFPRATFALDTVRVLVLPFEIYAKEDLSYLRQDIPKALERHLADEGAIVLDAMEAVSEFQPSDLKNSEKIRQIGLSSGADYILWGSLTRIGDAFSLDASMAEPAVDKSFETFHVEGERTEQLIGRVKELAGKMIQKLFRREMVSDVRVEGNQRIEKEAVLKKIKIQAGDVYRAGRISDDLKAVYAMGFFDDIRVEMEKTPAGNVVIFKVKEKSSIRVIRIKGNHVYETDEIKENLTIRTGSILNVFRIRRNIDRIEQLYREKNYHNAHVSYELYPLENNQVDLEFQIEEGTKVRIRQILFSGNEAYSDKKLKKIMKTSEKGFFSWLTSSGELNREDLNGDVEKLTAFYRNSGYVHARIGEPAVDFRPDGIFVNIRIDEGLRFKVGDVDIDGDLVLPEEDLIQTLKIAGEEFYSREIVRNDVLALSDLYSDEGYAYADIVPRLTQDDEKRIVNIVYTIQKGKQVYFEKIIIAGNTKTRDKVIRRQLKVYEQELYSGKRLKRGIRNLYRLDYFEDIKVDTVKGSADDQMILTLDVTEKPTGMFSFGGGYSSVENLFVVASVSQRNLFGRGQTLSLKAELGSTTTEYTLSFTEPWLFDIPLSAGFDLFNWTTEYDDYDKDSTGFAVRFGYPVFDYTRAYISYKFDITDVYDIVDDASKTIMELDGENLTSSITASLRYDSRDRMFNPTEGSDHSLTIEHSGGVLGGDIAFTKYTAETGWYIPLLWDTVGFVHGRGGYVQSSGGGILPDYERFYLGGMNSVRGYDWQDIHAEDEDGDEIGGDKFMQFNAELIVPLLKKAGVVGVLFYDAGDVYGADEDPDFATLKESIGYGFRWYSPMGPIRIEYGYMLDPEEGEDTRGRWEFTMGSAF